MKKHVSSYVKLRFHREYSVTLITAGFAFLVSLL